MAAHTSNPILVSDRSSSAPESVAQNPSKGQLWTGRVLSGIAVAFFTNDALGKLLRLDVAVEGAGDLGYPASAMLPIGILALVGTILYVIPRTAVLGAIFLTGFLGGAIASQVRVEAPLFSHILFPTYMAALIWGGLLLRKPGVRGLLMGGK